MYIFACLLSKALLINFSLFHKRSPRSLITAPPLHTSIAHLLSRSTASLNIYAKLLTNRLNPILIHVCIHTSPRVPFCSVGFNIDINCYQICLQKKSHNTFEHGLFIREAKAYVHSYQQILQDV